MNDPLMRSSHYQDSPFPRANVARVQAGYIGQIYVGDSIVWESLPFEKPEDAGQDAYEHITNKMKELFA